MCEEGSFHVIHVLAQSKKKKKDNPLFAEASPGAAGSWPPWAGDGPRGCPPAQNSWGMSGTQSHSRHRSHYPTTLTHFSFFVRVYHSFSQMTQVRSDVQCHFERPPESPVPSDAAQAQHGPQGGRRRGSSKREDWRQSVGPEFWASAVGLPGCQFCWNR